MLNLPRRKERPQFLLRQRLPQVLGSQAARHLLVWPRAESRYAMHHGRARTMRQWPHQSRTGRHLLQAHPNMIGTERAWPPSRKRRSKCLASARRTSTLAVASRTHSKRTGFAAPKLRATLNADQLLQHQHRVAGLVPAFNGTLRTGIQHCLTEMLLNLVLGRTATAALIISLMAAGLGRGSRQDRA